MCSFLDYYRKCSIWHIRLWKGFQLTAQPHEDDRRLLPRVVHNQHLAGNSVSSAPLGPVGSCSYQFTHGRPLTCHLGARLPSTCRTAFAAFRGASLTLERFFIILMPIFWLMSSAGFCCNRQWTKSQEKKHPSRTAELHTGLIRVTPDKYQVRSHCWLPVVWVLGLTMWPQPHPQLSRGVYSNASTSFSSNFLFFCFQQFF